MGEGGGEGEGERERGRERERQREETVAAHGGNERIEHARDRLGCDRRIRNHLAIRVQGLVRDYTPSLSREMKKSHTERLPSSSLRLTTFGLTHLARPDSFSHTISRNRSENSACFKTVGFQKVKI